MGHTNSTVNYNLPQFVGADKPSWLGDVNGAFLAIDTAIAAAKTQADSAAGGVASLQTTVGSHTTQIGTLTETVTAQGGTLNSVTALIGNGTPTTTDQTIIGAINEINARITENTMGTGVDLSGYTSSNKYVCPSDGYVTVYVSVTGTAIAHLGGSVISCTNNGDVAIPTFVRKGQEVYPTLTGGGGCSFYAFQ